MKKQILGMVAAAGFVVLVAAPAFAQTGVVRVPFQFVAGKTVLPAGTYTVRADPAHPSVLRITSTNGRSAGIVATEVKGQVTGWDDVVLRFRKYGDAYLLAQVAMPDDSVREVPLAKTVVEHDLAKVAMLRYERHLTSNG